MTAYPCGRAGSRAASIIDPAGLQVELWQPQDEAAEE